MSKQLKLKFDPNVIEHLGVKMYSSIPPVLAELVANAYDADATNVLIRLLDSGDEKEIVIEDNGEGMAFADIRDKFLLIGRNRRDDAALTLRKRKPIGKKGLGKLSFFGVVSTIQIQSFKDNRLSSFTMDWEDMIKSKGEYKINDFEVKDVECNNGTIITLKNVKRTSVFNALDTASKLAKYFLFDSDFNVNVKRNDEEEIKVTYDLKYKELQTQFEWAIPDDITNVILRQYFEKKKVVGRILTTRKPIPPRYDSRGLSLFSRTKLVQTPYSFSDSTSSNFYSYLTGHLQTDFIDELDTDVISTNRRELNWEHPETEVLHNKISLYLKQISAEWRKKRKDLKQKEIKDKMGIDTINWVNQLETDEIKRRILSIVENIGDDDWDREKIVEDIYALVPPYPLLHWRNLHPQIQDITDDYYTSSHYFAAAEEALKHYCACLKEWSGLITESDELSLFSKCFGKEEHKLLHATANTLRHENNIEEGLHLLSIGAWKGFRNPIAHISATALRDEQKIFSNLDCLNILGLISYLMYKAEQAKERKDTVDSSQS